jgi:hypothetical protein
MIQALRLASSRYDKGPFTRSGSRLRVSVYCPEGTPVSADEAFKLGLIRELAHVDSLRIAENHHAAWWRFEVDPLAEHCPCLRLLGPDGDCSDHALWPRDPVEEAHRLLGPEIAPEQACTLALRYPLVDAHCQAERDVFVTTDRSLLAAAHLLPEANIRTVSEGLRIIGLYLRSMNDFTVAASPKVYGRIDRLMFYWIACGERLRPLSRYLAACAERGKLLADGTSELANSIVFRCVRVLQARDEIGFKFCGPQGNSTRDAMLYHFEYLTLLLVGAIDAGARVAARAYGLANRIRSASFRKADFVHALADAGGDALAGIVRSPKFHAYLEFLALLRNAIHGAGLSAFAFIDNRKPEVSLLRVHEDAERIWNAVGRLELPDQLGVSRIHGVTIEPYTCAVTLTDLGFRYLIEVARATELSRLLPDFETAALTDSPPFANLADEQIRRKVIALAE